MKMTGPVRLVDLNNLNFQGIAWTAAPIPILFLSSEFGHCIDCVGRWNQGHLFHEQTYIYSHC